MTTAYSNDIAAIFLHYKRPQSDGDYTKRRTPRRTRPGDKAMTTIDIILRINDAIRNGDQEDLVILGNTVAELLIEDKMRDAWLALIETASDSIDGAFC